VKHWGLIVLWALLPLLGLTAWDAASPLRRLNELRRAVETTDLQALDACLDAPALQASLRASLQARADARAAAHAAAGPGKNKEALADLLEDAAVEPMAQAFSRPLGLSILLLYPQDPESAYALIQAQARALSVPATVTPAPTWALAEEGKGRARIDVQGNSPVATVHLHLKKRAWADWKLEGISF
jgi:hypothetical protein